MATASRRNGDDSKWKGVMPAIMTPLTPEGEINEAALTAALDDNIGHGVHGFWIAGGTGEGVLLTDDQRARVASIAGQVCRGRALSIMHVGAPTTASAVRAARVAREAGCDAICCVPPVLYRPTDQGIIDHYKAVTDAAGDLPFFVYNLPQMTNVETAPPLMEKLVVNLPTLLGMKHSALNFADIGAFTDMGVRVFSGNGLLPLPALAMGAVGTIDAPPGLAPWVYVDLFRAWEAGDITTARARQQEIRPIVNLVRMFGAPQHAAKVIMAARTGIDCGEPIPPVNRLSVEQQELLLAGAKSLGLLASRKPAAT